ncbi:MAG: hypothetical protein ACOX8S_08635 [Christensenellales bacterium]|jgi:hypothetical protein
MARSKTGQIKTKLVCLAALLSILFAAMPFLPIALAQEVQENQSVDGANRSNTTLIIYADDDQNKLLALFLVADSPENGLLSVLSIPVNSRAIVSSGVAQYAPIKATYSQGADLQSKIAGLAESVHILLDGAPLDRVIALSPQNLREIINKAGGMRVNISDMPPVSIVDSPGASLTYPLDSSNDSLAVWLKRNLPIQGKNSDYDIDVAKSISGLSPDALTNPDMTSLVLSGDQAIPFLEFTIFPNNTGTDILQIRRLQHTFDWVLQMAKENGGIELEPSSLLYHDDGEPFLEGLYGYESETIRGSMVFPSGIDRAFAGESHWVFDTVWLHDWIMEYIYLK